MRLSPPSLPLFSVVARRGAFALLFAFSSLVAFGQNLLSNGDFSQTDANGKPLDWTAEDSSIISIDTTDHPSGVAQSLSVALPTSGGSSLGFVQQSLTVASSGAPLAPNGYYAARVSFKSSASGQAELQVKRFHGGVEVDRLTSTTSGTSWAPVTLGFDTNPGSGGQTIDQVQVLLRYKKNALAGQVAKFADAELLDSAGSTLGTLRLVPTFESLSVYAPIDGALAPTHTVEISYRPTGTTPWLAALPPQRATADNEFRGSIMLLQPNQSYDVQVVLKLNGATLDTQTTTQSTWADAETYDSLQLHPQPSSASTPLVIDSVHGADTAWAHYYAASGGSVISVGTGSDYALYINNSSYVEIDGLALQGGRINAILINNSDHIRVRNCDISGWSEAGTFGKNTTTGVDVKYAYFNGTPFHSSSPNSTLIIERAGVHVTGSGSQQVVIERNLIHHPLGKSASWAIDDNNANDNHPAGPSGIILDETGGNNVVRDNDIIAGDGHRFNDVIEGNQNGNPTGGPSLDTDISGNLLAGSNDDGTELDGGQKNVRYWHNWVEGTHSQISTAPVLQGPSYIFQNVFVGGDERGTTEDGFKMGGASGLAHFINNTVFTQNYGFSGGHSEGPTTAAFMRNNIFAGPVVGNGLLKFDKIGSWTITGDIDYDLTPVNGINALDPAGKEPNRVEGYPNFSDPDERSFLLMPGSPGVGAGAAIANLTPSGVTNPDMGAIDVAASSAAFPLRTATPDVFPLRSVVRVRTGNSTTTPLQLVAPTTTGSTWQATLGESWLSLSSGTGSTGATPQNLTCTINASSLAVGTHATFVSFRTDTGALRTALLVVEVEPATDISFVTEAEDLLPSGGFESITDSSASGGAYAHAYSGASGAIRQDFTVAAAGDYYVHARVRADGPSALLQNQNSFNLHIDGTVDQEWDLAGVGTDWSWDTAHVVPLAISSDVTGPINLTAGAHYIEVEKRSAGVQLDVIVISNSPYPPRVATPAFSPTGGSYGSAQTVAITSGTGGATIRYTTDGSTPTRTHGTIYSSAITLSTSTLLRAIAYKDQMEDSKVLTDFYALGGAFEMSGNLAVMEAENYTSKTSATDDWTLITDAGASGGASNNALQSLPNDGTAYATLDPNSAHVDYLVDVPSGSAANFYVHIRDYGATSTDDSVFVSIDGSTTTYLTVTAGRTLDWKSTPGTLAIGSGLHTITIWDREDGTEIDKIVVSSSSTPPTGSGPAESTRTSTQVAAPTFSPGGGVYFSGKSVAIASGTSGATIRYTTDGSTPSETNGAVYSGPVSISGATTTLKAIAYSGGMVDSNITSADYTLEVYAPQFSPLPGTYSTTQSVAITSATSGATIRYTTDGSVPSQTNGTVYSSPVSISTTTTLQAIAYETGLADSEISSGTYTISLPPTAAPTFSPAAGTYTSTQSVTISTTTTGATIRYTTDGSTPSETNGTVYASPVSIAATTTLKAIAYASGNADSAVTSGTYTILSGQVAAPSFSPAAGSYSTAQSVTISTATTGATIRYTTDGSTPTSSNGTVYSGAITLDTSRTLQAIAYKSGMADSTVTSGDYTLTAPFEMVSGEVAIEAEHYLSIVNGTDSWQLITDASASGASTDNALQLLPNDGTAYASFDSSAAHVDYAIDVPTSGNYYIHLRDYGATSSDDSVYVSIDGGTATTLTVTAGRTLDWKSTPSTLAIGSGVHTITIWDREDGFELDKLVVSTSSTAPTGTGPTESARSGDSPGGFLGVDAPQFNPAGGSFTTAPAVTIATATAGAAIRYTLDGTEPSLSAGTVYSAPVVITDTATLKAIAFLADGTASAVTGDTYTIAPIVLGPGEFLMNGGQLVMEAENFSAQTGGAGQSWLAVTTAGASGAATNNAMQALPNLGIGHPTLDPGAPRLDYAFDVPAGAGGSYYVHLRDLGATSNDDSVYASIDGSTTVSQVVSAGRTLDWKTSAGPLAVGAGRHTLTLWMREDGIVIDKIVVDAHSTAPTGFGPAESGRAPTTILPAITTQPVSQTATVGDAVQFGVAATGAPAPTYQWFKDGAPLAGATDATLILSRVVAASAGEYAVVATNIVGSVMSEAARLTVNKAAAAVALSGLAQSYDGQPKPVLAATTPAGLNVTVTYAGAARPPVNPGTYAVTATIDDSDYEGRAVGALIVTITARVAHAPTLNGSVAGSVQLLSPESFTLNHGAAISGDVLVPGSPTVQLNGAPAYGGTLEGEGAEAPVNYGVTLNHGATVRHLVRRIDPTALAVVETPPAPTGTRTVVLNHAGDGAGDFATVCDLTLNNDAGAIAVPPGTYGDFIANHGGGFTLGVAGATTPAVYNLQSLTLNGGSRVEIAGPVILTVAGNVSLNDGAVVGADPARLTLRIAQGGLTLNAASTLQGLVLVPQGAIALNARSQLVGRVECDRLSINSDGVLRDGGR